MCGSFMVTTSDRSGQPVALAVRGLVGRYAGVPHRRRGTADPRRSAVAGVIRSSWSPVGAEPGALTVDAHRADRQQEVEVEAREVLGGADVQPGPAGEPPRAERVAVADVVVQDVDAAVAVLREVGVADPGRARGRGLLAAAARARRRQPATPEPGPSECRDEPGADDHAAQPTRGATLIGCRSPHRPHHEREPGNRPVLHERRRDRDHRLSSACPQTVPLSPHGAPPAMSHDDFTQHPELPAVS